MGPIGSIRQRLPRQGWPICRFEIGSLSANRRDNKHDEYIS